MLNLVVDRTDRRAIYLLRNETPFMVLVYIPHGPGGVSGREPTGVERIGVTRHYVCGFVGFGIALGVLAGLYSLVVAVTSAIPLLSTTALVFLGVVLWVLVWLTLDALVAWAGRRATAGR
jgi:hypothetical protein